MSVITNNLLLGDEGYFLTKSLRFRSSASAYLNRTFGTPTLSTKWTWSGWLKFGYGSSYYTIFDGGSPDTRFGRDPSTNQLYVNNDTTNYIITTPVYRDYSAWYHAVLAFDSSQGTASNRLRLYINGSEVTAFATDNRSSISGAIGINTATAHGIGRQPSGGSAYFDGYMTEINFIDGQQLTPSSFGQTSSTTGVWQPIKYTGTYGTNGFYLPFTDVATTSGSNAGLGKDFSGNGNYWTTNNISVTSGSTYDSMKDVPTLTDTDTANYAVMNPLVTGSFTTLSNGNLNTLGNTSSNNGNSRSSFAMLTGKWYLEVTLTANALSTYPQLGIMTTADGNRPNNGYPQAGYSGSSVNPSQSVIYMANGQKQISDTASSYGSSFTNGDVIGIAIDSDNGAIYFAKNGTWQNSGVPTSGSSKTGAALTWTGGTVEHLFSIADYNGTATAANFGQRPFAYTPPTGFVALNTFNLPTPTIGATASSQANRYFDVNLYTGTGSTLNITGLGFQPDFVWIKQRSGAQSHCLYDAVRGATKQLNSNNTGAEGTYAGVSSFNSDGYTIGTADNNTNGATYVGWDWKANGSGSTNTAGSITSTVSANTTAGFSIVTYTSPNLTADQTVGHGLGVEPSFIIVKNRTGFNWDIYHKSLGYNSSLTFTTSATRSGAFGSTINSTVFTTKDNYTHYSTNPYVAYCFAEVAGYSKFGSYTGNGSTDGPFVFCGFRPRYILWKNASAVHAWYCYDTVRQTYNAMTTYLSPTFSDAEGTNGGAMDILSNGFKVRNTGGDMNANGNTIIYMAFAENPFKYSLAR